MNIIIIGATSGIGKAIYEYYATKDNLIAIVGRRTHLLEQLRQKYPSHTIMAKADITNLSKTKETLDYLCQEMPPIDLAIVCSGTGDINKSLDYSKERPTIETNITGWTFVVGQLYRRLERQGHGHLVAISSVGGLRGEPNAPSYSASKAYQINYMESLRKKAFKNGGQIIVTDIRPGLVDTAMAKGKGLFWVMPVEKAAKQICKAIFRQKSKAYITRRWHLLAIIIRNLPFAWYKRI